MALALGVPSGFFLSRGSQFGLAEEGFHFRRLRMSRKLDRDRVVAQLALVAELVGVLEQYIELPPVSVPVLAPTGPTMETIESAASVCREEFALGLGPISSMVTLLENRGCVVTRLRADTSSIDAFSGWIRSRPYIVLASDKSDTARSRFDAAHELGHLVLHPDADPASPRQEAEAHRFASAFLIPRSRVHVEFPNSLDWPALLQLKVRWRVSLQALMRRALDAGKISNETYRRGLVHVSQRGWRRIEPGDVGPAEEPTLLRRALDLAADTHGLNIDDLGATLSLHPSDLSPLLGDSSSLLMAG